MAGLEGELLFLPMGSSSIFQPQISKWPLSRKSSPIQVIILPFLDLKPSNNKWLNSWYKLHIELIRQSWQELCTFISAWLLSYGYQLCWKAGDGTTKGPYMFPFKYVSLFRECRFNHSVLSIFHCFPEDPINEWMKARSSLKMFSRDFLFEM